MRLINADCLEHMATLQEHSFDSCVTDPPYHLTSVVKRFGGNGAKPAQYGEDGAFARASKGFMGRTWDGGDVAFRPETWAAVLRVLKPGAYLVCFSSTRTYHRMVCAIEDAGFIIHPMHGWIFGQGMAKGARAVGLPGWEGWHYGTQSTKPALEPICLAQRPFSEATGTANVERWGVGAVNVDGCRIFTDHEQSIIRNGEATQDTSYAKEGSTNFAMLPGKRYVVTRLKPGATLNKTGGNWRPEEGGIKFYGESKPGRWPANVIHDGSEEVLAEFPYVKSGVMKGGTIRNHENKVYGNGLSAAGVVANGQDTYGDEGSAARFFYASKASKYDRAGSAHPTVKPVNLMRWLCRLVTPPRGIILDPFAGSGTTGAAARLEGFDALLIEREPEYFADIQARMAEFNGDWLRWS